MHQFRVTKYDPAQRNERGHYLRTEWTSFSDVGRELNGSSVTLEEYERIETAYIDSAVAFMREAGVCSLYARAIENYAASPSAPQEGVNLSLAKFAGTLRDVLREDYWCRFEGDGAFVHIGRDYYMYIGVPVPCESSRAIAERQRLFVEPFDSPFFESTDLPMDNNN